VRVQLHCACGLPRQASGDWLASCIWQV
jgi:hypothetical protein